MTIVWVLMHGAAIRVYSSVDKAHSELALLIKNDRTVVDWFIKECTIE
jgi:hypothetical protein